jgi:hypothetical protein
MTSVLKWNAWNKTRRNNKNVAGDVEGGENFRECTTQVSENLIT